MTLRRCVACGRRYATVPVRCPRCGGSVFEPAPVSDEEALVEAVTVVDGIPLAVASLADLPVLVRTGAVLAIGDRVLVRDRPGGGFQAAAAPA